MKRLLLQTTIVFTIAVVLGSFAPHSSAQGRDPYNKPRAEGRDGGRTSNPPARPRDDNDQSGSLTGAYYFDLPGTQPSTVTVTITGTFIRGAGRVGDTSFTKTITERVYPGNARHISFFVHCLRRGTWSVTAGSNVGGAATCNASVPGIVWLNVAGGNGPSCSVPFAAVASRRQ